MPREVPFEGPRDGAFGLAQGRYLGAGRPTRADAGTTKPTPPVGRHSEHPHRCGTQPRALPNLGQSLLAQGVFTLTEPRPKGALTWDLVTERFGPRLAP